MGSSCEELKPMRKKKVMEIANTTERSEEEKILEVQL
jgi:hypothetical protein